MRLPCSGGRRLAVSVPGPARSFLDHQVQNGHDAEPDEQSDPDGGFDERHVGGCGTCQQEYSGAHVHQRSDLPAEPPDRNGFSIRPARSSAASLLTVAALAVTIWFAIRDRRRSEALRQEDASNAARAATEAEQRLRDERNAANRRLLDERADLDRRQVRDWQAAAALDLLDRIAGLQPYFGSLTVRGSIRSDERDAAVLHLQQGAHAQALALGNRNATELYRRLAANVVGVPTAMRELPDAFADDPEMLGAVASMVVLNTRRHARYVRLWLCHLIERGQVPDEAVRDAPLLTAVASAVMWTPMLTPDGWWEDTNTDPDDPQFSLRRR